MDTNELSVPKTLRDAILFYSDPKRCHDLMVSIRWPNGVACPHCGSVKVGYLESVARFKCYEKECRKQFSLKTGTVLEDSPIPLTKWFPAFWLLTTCRNGISSCELARTLGVCQKSAWFMLHRIRHILATGTFEKLTGTVEADETFIGGLEKNKHKDKKLRQGRGGDPGVGKSIVVAVLERSEVKGRKSKVRTQIIPDRDGKTLKSLVKKHVEPGSVLYTDAHGGYRGLSEQFAHEFVDHAIQYALGAIHTNGTENFWSLLKRGLKGTYVSVEPFHLTKYIDEQAYRFNNRELSDAARFVEALKKAIGHRLTYEELTSEYEEYFEQIMPQGV